MIARHTSPSDAGTVALGAAAILTVAVCLGLAANHLSTHSLPLFASPDSLRPPIARGVRYMSVVEARELLSKPGVVFVDARSPEPFEVGHIRGAINLPVAAFAKDYGGAAAGELRKAELLVCYCETISCDEGARLTQALFAGGYPNVALMFEGWEAWKSAGYPTACGR
jgi:rhodanese-related sulfurtransferase